jgi:hypothetical protein
MLYKVTYEYRGKVTIEVEADNEKDAENKGLPDADEAIAGNLQLYDVSVKPV